jgi:hypothetical protein
LVSTYNSNKTKYETYLLAVKAANTAAAANPTAKPAEITLVPQPNLPYTPESYS